MARTIDFTGADPAFAASSRYRRIGERFLITSATGRYAFLSEDEFRRYLKGSIEPDEDLYRSLAEKGLVRAEVDIAGEAERTRRRKGFLDQGPHLHIVEVTLRCNQSCVYCHSSRTGIDAPGKDMSPETADRVVEMIFETPSAGVTIEFQGGEPLLNFPAIRRVVESALRRNESADKQLSFSLVTNLLLMDDEKLEFLLDNRVQICTSLDGPEAVHNRQRPVPGGNAYRVAAEWVAKINRAYAERGLDPDVYHVEGLLTTTGQLLEYPEETVDTFVSHGFKALFLRPLDPFGFASRASRKLLFTPDEYLAFYRKAVDYMIELNLGGTQILERYAAMLLTRILTDADPNFLDLRSPCGAGIGQLTYGHDGAIYTCDEGRMLHNMGDDFFRLGSVADTTYREAVTHDTVRAVTLASLLDASADCADCVYRPYCGICPVYNYATQGSLHGQMRTSAWCAILMGIQDYLFTRLLEADDAMMAVFDNWVAIRERDYYLHGDGSGADATS
jgi:His-Xaa-Ser system radical SAM maturase HxsB